MTAAGIPDFWLAPGQLATDRFRVTGEREPLPEALDDEAYRLTVGGLVERPLELTLSEVRTLATYTLDTDIHCVTGWSYRAMRFTGFPLVHLLNMAKPLDTARFAWFLAYSRRNHATSLPLEVARAETWIVTEADGQSLSPDHGYPVRTVTPSRYFYKSLKWLRHIELLAEDRLGFWEGVSHYHNNADPWAGDQRYASGTMTPKQVERLKKAVSFDRYRDRVIVSVDLSGWRPETRDLQGMQFKNCNFRGAQLRGVDFRRGNLTNSDLRDADLAGADLRDADLEGARFAGADLTDADFRGAILNATQFYETRSSGTIHGAVVIGMRWDDAINLYPEQETFLKSSKPDRSP
ncbi:MAG: molybdopterin-dependent oxidoreductase [candidate division Zixibacteria bacterium]|nr:molybdopterin-dependent oxidoreductase [candidate division Zixibacteria bacterium]